MEFLGIDSEFALLFLFICSFFSGCLCENFYFSATIIVSDTRSTVLNLCAFELDFFLFLHRWGMGILYISQRLKEFTIVYEILWLLWLVCVFYGKA